MLHDLEYTLGGTEEDRLQADERLKKNVRALGSWHASNVMYYGVRKFGSKRFGTGDLITLGERIWTDPRFDIRTMDYFVVEE